MNYKTSEENNEFYFKYAPIKQKIKNIDSDKNSRLIVETIVDFAKKSGKKTIAEFVHSKKIFEITKSLNIDYFQGFYLGEPAPHIKM